MTKRAKTFLIIIIILAIIAGAVFFSKKATPAATNSTGLASTGDALGGASAKKDTTNTAGVDDFAAALANIKSVSIDTAIFNDPVYKTLQDNPVSLGTDVIGRNNPFAPVGTDAPDPAPFVAPQQEVVSANGPTITTSDVIGIQKTAAKFGAQVSIDATQNASVVFEYGTTETLGSATAPIKVKASGPVMFAKSKLLPKTQYFVRATMMVGDTTVQGDIIAFNTL